MGQIITEISNNQRLQFRGIRTEDEIALKMNLIIVTLVVFLMSGPAQAGCSTDPLHGCIDHGCRNGTRECSGGCMCTNFICWFVPTCYTIVKFPNEENQVAVVPSSWVVGTSCYWPPEKEERKIGIYVRKNKVPSLDWQFLDCNSVETYETYEEAREMLPLAASTSDLNADREYGRGKRKRVRRVYSDEEDDCSPPVTPPISDRTEV
ncbi:uncharacterized protein LOC135388295 [Ornithodoros turicata]|uniref:uncharacterized protein LOC135388295 n=1 Tax=Ornithodoros turicata TaxID=34597 RepID=UPI003138A7E0